MSSSLHTDSIKNSSLPAMPNINDNGSNIDKIYEKLKTLESLDMSNDTTEIPNTVSNKINHIHYSEHFNNILYADITTKRIICNNKTILETNIAEDSRLKTDNRIHLPKPNSAERIFLQLVKNGDVDSVQKYVEDNSGIDINCVDFQGISALHIAVLQRSQAMVEFLLKQPNIDLGDTILHAVRDNSIKILVILLAAQKKISPGLEFAGAIHSTTFPGHVTPLIMAAQSGHYEIVNILIARGHTIIRPHPPLCSCNSCKQSIMNSDHLYASTARLSAYQAISSPVYIVHVSPDPILSAFHFATELTANAATHRQLASAYLELRDDVGAFAVDIIGCCRTSEEVELILKQSTGFRGCCNFVLPRLLMAVKSKQKEFVAHPNTQQVLQSHWLGDWYNWQYMSFMEKAMIMLCRVFIMPFIVFMCMIAPRHSLVRHWQIPLNKLITHSAAYFVFLALVFYISNQDKTYQKRGPPNTGAEGPLVLYVCGYIWSAIRMCVLQGPRRYFTEMWNWAEIIMLALFGVTFAFWIAAAIDVAANDHEDLERKYWSQYDPTLLAEGTFCLATIFAYFRLMFMCQLNYHLGPLQVCLGKMIIDIYKYIMVFAIIICAFAAGLARFYQYYDNMVYEDDFGMKTVQVSSFTSLTDTLNTLFWALFCMAPLESGDVVLENTRKVTQERYENYENRHTYTERIGYFCFGCFEVISVIVVLNMLIATMSNTFQKVTDNVAIEWTFGRTEMYIDYMSQTTLPSPFNLIPTAAGMSTLIDWFRTRIGIQSCCQDLDAEANLQNEYAALVSVLVQRYFRDKTAGLIINGSDKSLNRVPKGLTNS